MQKLLYKLNRSAVNITFDRGRNKQVIKKLMHLGFCFKRLEHNLNIFIPSNKIILQFIKELVEIEKEKKLLLSQCNYFDLSRLRDEENLILSKIADYTVNGQYYKVVSNSIIFFPTLNKYYNNYIHNSFIEVKRKNTKKKKRNFKRINKK